MKRHLIPAAIFCIATGIFVFWRHENSVNREPFTSALPAEESVEGDGIDGSLNSSSIPGPTRSKNRVLDRRPSVVETTKLLKETTLREVNFPEEVLGDRIKRINSLIAEAGVPNDQLHLRCRNRDLLEIKLFALELRDVPIAMVLKYTAANYKFHSVIRRGSVEFSTTESPPDNSKQPSAIDADDPFAN